MKKLKFISLVIILMAVTVCSAQSNADKHFEKSLQELVFGGALGNVFNPSQMEGSFKQLAAEVVGPDKAAAKTQEYLNTQMMTDAMSVLSPYYKKTMSVEDITYLIERCNTPEGKVAVQHCAILNSTEGQTELQSSLLPAMMNALQGLPYEKIKPVACAESYKAKCYQYLEATGSGNELIEGIFSSFNGMAAQLSGEEAKEFQTVMDNLKTFMVDNLPVIYLNMSHGQISEADFDFFIDLYSSPAGQNYTKGNSLMVKDLMNVGMQLVEKFSAWMLANK